MILLKYNLLNMMTHSTYHSIDMDRCQMVGQIAPSCYRDIPAWFVFVYKSPGRGVEAKPRGLSPEISP